MLALTFFMVRDRFGFDTSMSNPMATIASNNAGVKSNYGRAAKYLQVGALEATDRV
jgi:hypothetical protein